MVDPDNLKQITPYFRLYINVTRDSRGPKGQIFDLIYLRNDKHFEKH